MVFRKSDSILHPLKFGSLTGIPCSSEKVAKDDFLFQISVFVEIYVIIIIHSSALLNLQSSSKHSIKTDEITYCYII